MTDNNSEVVDVEVVEDSTKELAHELALAPKSTLGQTFWSDDPKVMMAAAVRQADVLTDIIEKKGMSTRIRSKKHINIEGWQTLGAMVGVFAVTEWSRELVDSHGINLGWEARAHAVTADGSVVGAAEAECRRTESTWKDRDSYALRSMAQTRAHSKALRGPLGFIVHIAGYSATPDTEMEMLLTPYQRTARLAVKLAGSKEKGKEAYLVACASIDLDPTDSAELSAEDASRIMMQLDVAFPDAHLDELASSDTASEDTE